MSVSEILSLLEVRCPRVSKYLSRPDHPEFEKIFRHLRKTGCLGVQDRLQILHLDRG